MPCRINFSADLRQKGAGSDSEAVLPERAAAVGNILQITRTIEFARHLVQTWTEHGVDAFRAALENCARLIANETGDSPADLDSRFGIVVAGVLSVLFPQQPEILIRRQAILNQAISKADAPGAKAETFVHDLSALLEELAGEDETHRFSQRVRLSIRSCPLDELRNLTVESLADRLGYSRSHLSRRFHQETLVSLREEIQEEKLRRGYEILRSGRSRVSIRALSQQLGFGDPAYFSRIFREKFGHNPGELH